jgi:hypothetical protein
MTDAIIVTMKPTLSRDRQAMSRLIDAIESRMSATLPEIAHAILDISPAVKANSAAGLETNARFWREGGKLLAKVMP